MDIPNHPLRVMGLQVLDGGKEKEALKKKAMTTNMDICTCPKCGSQLYCPVGAISLKCTCGHTFSVKSCLVCYNALTIALEHPMK